MSILRKVRLAGLLFGVLWAAAFWLAPSVARAQSVASVTGTVTDSSGATVPGASIALVDTRTNTSYFAKTAGDGSYRISQLPPGPGYSLTVKKDGFQTFVVNSLYLPVATATTQDVKLELGTVSQKVEVTAEGSVTLDTTDTQIGNNIDAHAIQSLPNEFRDDPANLLRLEVGVVSAITPSGGPTGGVGSIDPNLTRDGAVAGARTDQGNIVVDNIDASNISSGFAFQTEAAIPVEAIQEFNTIVGNPLPQYGGRSGSQTLITTKSGTNDWHGSVYEYNRNAATEANSFFNQIADVPRTALVRNQFGANVGGPAWKDKFFFFFEYDGRRDGEAASVLDIVPFPHVKLGELAYINDSGGGTCSPTSRLTSADVSTGCVTILSAAQTQALDPCSTTNCSATPGFVSPGIAPALLSLFNSRYPNPNDFTQGDGINSAGLRFNAPDDLTENGYFSREDFNINSKNKLFARFNFRNLNSVLTANAFPGDPLTSPDILRDRAWVVGETWLASPNLVNQFTYGETRQNESQPILFNPGQNFYELSFGEYSNPFDRQTAFTTLAPEPTFRDDVTWTHGNHVVSFGGEWNPIIIEDGIANDFTFVQEGLSTSQTLNPSLRPADILAPGSPSDPSGIAATDWDTAFVAGLGSFFDLQAAFNFTHAGAPLPQGSLVKHDYRIQDVAGYFNDAWKLRPSLTVNLGVRYQYQSVPYEVHGLQASFFNTNFRSLMQTRVENGLNGVTGTPFLTYSLSGEANHAPGLYPNDYHDFSPRIGVAWNPSARDGILGRLLGDRKTVIRAGGSIIFDETVVNNIIQLENQQDYTFGGATSASFIQNDITTSLETQPRFNSISSFPAPVPPPPFVTPVTPSFAIFNFDVDNRFRTPYSIITSLGVQRELPGGLQFEADYYGRFGRKLFVLADAAQTVNFVDPLNKAHSLVSDFTVLEKDAQANVAPASVAPLPFFEDILGPGGTNFVYTNFPVSLAQGNTGGIANALGFNGADIGLPPQFFVNALATNLGNSSYNALLITLRKRLSNNLQFDLDYTYSHAIDNNSSVPHVNGNFEPGVTSILCDATNAHVCRGDSEFDATNQITGYFVYGLPFGKGQRFAGNSGWLVNEVIGGWQISGIPTWRSGLALTAQNGIASTTSLAADAGEIFVGPRSALAENIHLVNGTVQIFRDPAAAAAAFTPVTGLEVGTRDNLRGPSFGDLDVAVAKNFPLWTERFRLQFRAEAYNVFNHTNFGLPNPTLVSAQFGQLTSEAGTEQSRVMQFALRFDF
jgi:carboxypeptidase family protein